MIKFFIIELLIILIYNAKTIIHSGYIKNVISIIAAFILITAVILCSGCNRDNKETNQISQNTNTQSQNIQTNNKVFNRLINYVNEGNIIEVEKILKKFNNIDINAHYIQDYTLLGDIVNNNIEMAELLLKYKAEVDMKDEYYKTALIWACNNRNLEMTKILLDAGDDKRIKDNSNRNALYYAEKIGNAEII